jgi:ssDNA-binding replication factor A large subunit
MGAMPREYEKHGFFSFSSGKSRELQCIKPGESDTTGRVLEVSRGEIRTSEGGKRAILQGIIADETAKLPLIADETAAREALVKDAVVQIENATVEKWKGLPTLYIRKDTKVHVIKDDSEFPGYAMLTAPKRRTIGETVECGGACDVIVEGTIVSIAGDAAEGAWILDDGTGAVTLRIKDEAKGTGISFGVQVKARGNVLELENGYVLVAEDVRISDDALVLSEMKNFLCRYT